MGTLPNEANENIQSSIKTYLYYKPGSIKSYKRTGGFVEYLNSSNHNYTIILNNLYKNKIID